MIRVYKVSEWIVFQRERNFLLGNSNSLFMTHVKIFIILMKKNFQRCAVAHIVAFHMHILEVGSLLLWKFGLGCYTPFCSSLALCAAIRR